MQSYGDFLGCFFVGIWSFCMSAHWPDLLLITQPCLPIKMTIAALLSRVCDFHFK